ncbi:MAG: hypothetical protein KDB53_01940, partial [Planctomycetes bacterium]|nr:hypothetical protein [Planctomycetota bacterium]
PARRKPARDQDRPARRERPEKKASARPDDLGQTESRPKPRRAAEKPAEPEGIVCGKPKEWGLPTGEGEPRPKPERAPHHRTGRQPTVNSGSDSSSFGDGVDDD